MASICSIIPHYLLKTIIDKGEADDDIVAECRSTLDQVNQLQTARIEHSHQIALASQGLAQESAGVQGIIPPYIHQAILRGPAGEEEREASRRTLEHDTKFRTTRRSERHLSRTVYDAQHRWSFIRDKIFIPEGGPPVSEIDDPSNDGNECYNGFKKTYDFYLEHFNRDSLDNRGLPLEGFVHYGQNFGNAFWDGKKMVFGDGSRLFNGLTDELDVIGHELTHGVVQYTCNLKYELQSGALNESIADVFGIMVKQLVENPDKTAAEANWLIGEGIWRLGIKGKALRDMENPGTAFDDPRTGKDPQPAHWKDFVVMPNTDEGDCGGVHINSGIPNRAFVLASKKIGGLAWLGAGQIWYNAITSGELKREATFKEFADVTIKYSGEHAKDVQKAWEEVGYPFP